MWPKCRHTDMTYITGKCRSRIPLNRNRFPLKKYIKNWYWSSYKIFPVNRNVVWPKTRFYLYKNPLKNYIQNCYSSFNILFGVNRKLIWPKFRYPDSTYKREGPRVHLKRNTSSLKNAFRMGIQAQILNFVWIESLFEQNPDIPIWAT